MHIILGRARFTMGFLELVARIAIDDRIPKVKALRHLKCELMNKIVKSDSNVGLQRLLSTILIKPKRKYSK